MITAQPRQDDSLRNPVNKNTNTMQRKTNAASDAEKGTDITGDGGIIKTVLKEGTGELIKNGSTAKVHYRGTLDDGTLFDTSRTRGQPFKFKVGKRQVILGWDKGVATMKKGEICILRCAPNYAYGGSQVGPIPANSTLTFEVELLDFAEPGAPGSEDGLIPDSVRSLLGFVVLAAIVYFLYSYAMSDQMKV